MARSIRSRPIPKRNHNDSTKILSVFDKSAAIHDAARKAVEAVGGRELQMLEIYARSIPMEKSFALKQDFKHLSPYECGLGWAVAADKDFIGMAQTEVETFGRLDVAVNCAGVMDDNTAIADMSDEMLEKTFINTFGLMYGLREECRQFLAQGDGGWTCFWAEIITGNSKKRTAMQTAFAVFAMLYGWDRYLLNGLKRLVQLVQMRLQIGRLREAGQLAQRHTADKLHLCVFRRALTELIGHSCRHRIVQDVLYLAVKRECHRFFLLFVCLCAYFSGGGEKRKSCKAAGICARELCKKSGG